MIPVSELSSSTAMDNPKNLLDIFESIKSKLHNSNKRRLNVESQAQKIVNSLLLIDENRIFDPKIQITISELKNDAKSLGETISSQEDDLGEEINLRLSDIPDYKREIDEKNKLIRQLQKELRQKQVQTNNSIKKVAKTKSINVNEQMDVYSLRYEINRLKEQLEQKNYENNEMQTELVEKREALRSYQSFGSDMNDMQTDIKTLTLQKQQSDEFADRINKENCKLKQELTEIKLSMTQSTAGASFLQKQVSDLTAKLDEKERKLREYKTKSRQAEEDLRTNETKFSTMALDNDASMLKTELLIEEITSLKMELADKDNSYMQMKQSTEHNLMKAQSVLSSHKLLENENQLLQKQIADIRKEKQGMDQENIKLKVDLDNVRNKVQEKEMRAENYKVMIDEQKEKLKSVSGKLTKYVTAAREMKQIINQKDAIINELKTKNANQENAIKLKRDEIAQLKQQNKSLDNIIAENSGLMQKHMETKLELDAAQHKNKILQQSYDTQVKENQALSKDLVETRQNATRAHKEYDNLKFDSSKTISQYDSQVRSLQANNQQLQSQLDNARQETERQMQDYESRLLGQAADYEERINDQEEKYTTRMQKDEKHYQEQIKDLERRNFVINKSLDDTLKKVSDLTTEKASLENFKENVKSIVPIEENQDFFPELRSFVDTRSAALQQLKSVNKEMKRTQQKNQKLIYDTLKLSKSNGPVTSLSLAQEITNALTHANDKIQDLSQANDDKEEVIKQLKEQLEIANERTENLISAVNPIVEVNDVEDIPEALSRLNEDNKALSNTIYQSKAFIQCDNEDDLIEAVAKAHSDLLALNKYKIKAENELAERNTELCRQKNENKNLVNQIESIKEQVSSVVPIDNIDNVPSVVKQLRDKLETNEKNNKMFNDTLCQIVGCHTEEDLPKCLAKLTNDLNNCRIENEEYTNSLNVSPEQVTTVINDLKEKNAEYSKLMSRISKVDPTITQENAAEVLSELKDNLKDAKTNHNEFVDKLSSIISVHNEKSIPSTVQKIVDDLNESKSNHVKLVGSLSGLLGVQNEAEFEKSVKEILNDLSEEKKNRSEERRRHDSLIDSVKKVIDIKDESSIPDAIRELKNTIEEAQELLSSVVATVTHKDKNDVKLVLPFNPQVTATIQAAIADLVRKYDSLLSDVNEVIENATHVGYTGKSVIEASDFITDEAVRAKTEQLREETFIKIKQVREEGTKERILLEQRNQATNQKLAEIRQQKIELSDQSLSKQSELSSRIEELEKELRRMTNEVETIKKVREELIRLAANEVYDSETLRHNLTAAEKLRIHL